ncbi:hypothetical protein FKM82_025568 [Ascaphus truei]
METPICPCHRTPHTHWETLVYTEHFSLSPLIFPSNKIYVTFFLGFYTSPRNCRLVMERR